MRRWRSFVWASMLGAGLCIFGGGCDDSADIVFASLDLAASIINAAS